MKTGAEVSKLDDVMVPALYAAGLMCFWSMTGGQVFYPGLILGTLAIFVLRPKASGIKASSRMAVLGLLFCLSLLALTMLPGLRSGAISIAEGIFKASESKNRYHYMDLSPYFEQLSPLALAAARALICLLAAALTGILAEPLGGALLPLISLMSFAGFSSYFGLSPGPVFTGIFALCLGLCALKSLGKGLEIKAKLAILAAFAALCICIGLLSPGVDSSLEEYSEALRDRLASSFEQTESPAAEAPVLENATHQEGRYQDADARGENSEARPDQFQKDAEMQQDVSIPHTSDILRIILLLLASILAIIAPFALVYLAVRHFRKAQERRASFGSPDGRTAVKAMFNHILDCLRAFGLKDSNENYPELGSSAEALMGRDYALRFEAAAQLWNLASYSERSISTEEKDQLSALLKDTEALIYKGSGRWKRFKLRYIDCLVMPSEEY